MNFEYAKVFGEPIDPNLRVPDVISKIATVDTCEANDDYKYYSAYDSNVDDVYTADANGVLTNHKLTKAGTTTLSFAGLQSKLEYINLVDLYAGAEGNKAGIGVIGNKKRGITRAMDKEEVRRVCAACLALSGQEVTQATADDLYDLIMKMKHKIEDYADDCILLVGSTVKEAIDNFDKLNADNFYYNVKILEMLKNAGISEVIKLAGTFTNSSGAGQRLLAVDKLILVGRQSTISNGRPILFVRRKIDAAVAQKVEVDAAAQRIVVDVPMPVITDGTNNLAAVGMAGIEFVIEAIVNAYAISWATYA